MVAAQRCAMAYLHQRQSSSAERIVIHFNFFSYFFIHSAGVRFLLPSFALVTFTHAAGLLTRCAPPASSHRPIRVVRVGSLLSKTCAADHLSSPDPGRARSRPLLPIDLGGVPKLQRSELEGACEDFSNIVASYPHYTVHIREPYRVVSRYVSTMITSSKDWSKHSEGRFRKKTRSHELIIRTSYCEEEEPFMRMMVLEYAPNGTLYEHLHDSRHECLVRSILQRKYAPE
ncbi:uncharacterized protein LOC133889411 [Phragmites australis]|uniref:uncharacterized protein LOC133889411 n=1 Tax=Phragmites australis TaxID=29695 RepID=UPI002D78C4B5|nr:uncharacterized protein LOC133889411 [Phragmites australis]